MKHKISLALVAGLPMMGMIGCTTPEPPTRPTEAAARHHGGPPFPDLEAAWLKSGTFVDVEQLRRIGPGMSKDQVRELISYPHFEEGFFAVREWDYLFNFRTGRGNDFVTCQYKIVFEAGLSHAMFWRDPGCAEYLKPPPPEVVHTVEVVKVPVPAAASEPERFRLQADALFPFDRYSLADMLPEGRRRLDQLVDGIQKGYRRLDQVTVVGHSDPIGAVDYNQRLSKLRAESVRDYLAIRGLPIDQIRAWGVGKTEPVARGCTDYLPRKALLDCLQPDRRVEIEVRGERP